MSLAPFCEVAPEKRLSLVLHTQLLVLAILVLEISVPIPAPAQILYGGLLGDATDESGAVLVNARATAVNVETGVVREVSANESGLYHFPTLPPGIYRLEVRAAGFRTFLRTGVRITSNATVRVNAVLALGDVTESVTVASDLVELQTEGAQVRRELNQNTFNSVPIPLGRNYQLLLGTLPGISPPQNANSLAANPSRAVVYSVNGTSHQGNNVRIDGATSNNPNLPHNTALNPTLESIDVVNIVTNSFDAEQGLAGGAAVNVQIKSGSNALHGSAFWYHNDQAISAYPYFSDRSQAKPKFISNQFGGTAGGPIKRNRAFFFVSYERTNEHSNATRYLTVPTAAIRQGDLTRSTTPIYDPLTGAPFDPSRPNAYAADRTAFPGNRIPLSRFSAPTAKMLSLPDWGLPNATGGGAFGLANNYLGNIKYFAKRDQIDSKFNFNLTDKLTAFARLSYFYIDQDNPSPFGILGGPNIHPTNSRTGFGYGPTWSGTLSATYVSSPSLVFDAYYGRLLQDTTAGPADLDKNIGRDVLGIPGTNGQTELEGGMLRMFVDGFAQLGYPQVSPFFHKHTVDQYVANGNYLRGRHDLRFGVDVMRTTNDSREVSPPSGTGPAGAFWFRRDTTTLRGGPAGNDINAWASFLLGLPRESGRGIIVDPQYAHSDIYSLYIRDRWQISRRLTASFGVRWEYFPFPRRRERGMERYDLNTNEVLVCGLGSIPENCGNSQSKKRFLPRVGLAYRVTDNFVIRAGYGITIDPYPIALVIRGNYPTQVAMDLPFNDTRSWSTTLESGLPAPVVPTLAERIPLPSTVNFSNIDDNYGRGYVQSWNLMLERKFGGWVGNAGYVATRSIRQSSALDLNWAQPGTGNQGRQLFQKFQRTGTTRMLGHLGVTKYDSLQTQLQRRFGGGSLMNFSYTYSHSLGFANEASDSAPRVNNPNYWYKNYGDTPLDIRHNFTTSFAMELPFGKGKRWVTSGVPAKILGGWQVNSLAALRTGLPVTPTAPATVLNAPGSGNFADCNGPVAVIGDRTQWWDRRNLSDPNATDPNNPRFGTCGSNVLRGPGLVNVDLAVFRRLTITERIDLQFRAEAFNVSNTPHFANPNSDIAASGFGISNATQNTGREGIDHRFFRFGLRLGF